MRMPIEFAELLALDRTAVEHSIALIDPITPAELSRPTPCTGWDLAGLIAEVRAALPVPITGVVSDGQGPIRKAVRKALKGVPHQLCHFHYLREAAKPISEADRHAKKELKKRVRGIRPIERRAEKAAESDPEDGESEVVRGYCAAVRAASLVIMR